MMKRRACQCLALVLLSCVAAECSSVEGPEPLYTIKLGRLGYKRKYGRKTMVRFVQHYVVVEQESVPILERGASRNEDRLVIDPAPPATWIFDLRDRKQAPPTAIAGAEFDPLPEITKSGPLALGDDEIYPTAHWKDMTLLRDPKTGNMFLDEPGQTRKTICHGDEQCFHGDLVFLSESRFGRSSNYMALDGVGRRYARYRTYLDGAWAHFLEDITTGDFGEHNWGAVTVYSAENDKEIFVYRWQERFQEKITETEPCTQYNRLIALSHDGSLLAVVRRSELLIFQLPASN